MVQTRTTQDPPTLAISTDKVCYVVVKAREYDVQDVSSELEDGSNASDDGMVSVLEEGADNPVVQELVTFIAGLSEEEQAELVALAWLGRGDAELAGWADLRREAARHERHTARYLLGLPLLPDYLEDALAEFGLSCEDFERGHM